MHTCRPESEASESTPRGRRRVGVIAPSTSVQYPVFTTRERRPTVSYRASPRAISASERPSKSDTTARSEHGESCLCAVGRDSHGKAAFSCKNAAGKALAAVPNIPQRGQRSFHRDRRGRSSVRSPLAKASVVAAAGEDDGIGPHAPAIYLRLGPQDTDGHRAPPDARRRCS